MFRWTAIVLLLSVNAAGLFSQEAGRIDSLEVRKIDSLQTDEDSEPDFEMSKSPLGAVLRSAVIPGWGQFYNESYWKIPLVVGLSAYLVYGIISEHSLFTDYSALYDATITTDDPAGDLQLKQFREIYRDRRDTFAWWFLVTYLLQIADAFVDAHLYDFDVSEETGTSVDIHPTYNGLQLRIRF
jgi:hypothetical protein